MKQKMIAATVLCIATSIWAGDEIEIVKKRLSDDSKMISVTVEYELESRKECDLMIGLDYESSGSFTMEADTVRLNQGKGKVDITAPVDDQKLTNSISTAVLVNLSPVDRGTSWNQIAWAAAQINASDKASKPRLPGGAKTNVVIKIKDLEQYDSQQNLGQISSEPAPKSAAPNESSR